MVGREVSTEHRDEIDGEPVFWRSEGGASVLYVHGVPDTADEWEPFLVRTGGIAVDLPGFGRTTKRGDFDFSIEGYGRWLDRFAEHVGLDRFRLVVHDWGALALPWAVEHAERVVLLDPVPLLAGHRWSGVARVLRARGVGEVAIGLAIPPVLRRRLPADVVAQTWPHFDQGTQRAILRLYRGAGPEVLAAAGARLGELTAPALVVWGERDPYVPARFADAYGESLGGEARVLRAPGAVHWPWYDRPDLAATVAGFVSR